MVKLYKLILILTFAGGLLTACAGPDFMPQYFPNKTKDTPAEPSPNETPEGEGGGGATGSCTVSLTSTLCVSIYGEFVKVGVEGEEPLCADIPPVPIEVSGQNAILRGNTFPDIPFEGHGLPAPITINAKGSGDGKDNIGQGKVDASGNIVIEDFSFFINALGMIGEVPDLTLTTGATEELEGLGVIEGSPLAADGSVKIVIGTIIGHLFPAADEKLFGASLSAVFEGSIAPALSECKGGDAKPQSTFVTEIIVGEEGKQTEALLPGSVRMEIGQAYIAEDAKDIGPQFEESARFKIVNATAKAISIDIPPILGPFVIEGVNGALLKQELPPKAPLLIEITFLPKAENVKEAGEAMEMLTIGPDVYYIVADALAATGGIGVDVVSDGGVMSAQERLNVGEVIVTTTGRREFFTCQKKVCDGADVLTNCIPCLDVLINVCQLLPVDKSGNPIGTFDNKCNLVNPASKDQLLIGLGGGTILPATQTIEVKNSGVKPLIIESVTIEEIEGGKSKKQFKVSSQLSLPVTLEPYDINGDKLQVAVVYEPDDLIGFDGKEASVGRSVKDRAMLKISSADSDSYIELNGITSVKETPALQVYIKSATGTKEQVDGSQFAFRGLTLDTTDIAVPVFVKLSDSATNAIRVIKISVDSGSVFEWLDSKEKILSKPENTRCTVPIFDPSGGQSGIVTDLSPVSLLPNGFDLKPGAYNVDTMPLFGCVNFHMGNEKKRQYNGTLTISTEELDSTGQPVRNSDGSLKQSSMSVGLLGVINPLKGQIVFRLTQTMAGIMNPQFTGLSAAASKEETDIQIADGLASENDRFVMPGALILDPFDEETIKDESGNVITVPGDGVTAVYRRVDTRPLHTTYEDPLLPDYTSLIFDSILPDGEKGVFFDYPNVQDGQKSTSLRIHTASLSYPGPLASPEERPESLFLCQQVDSCTEEGQRMHGEGPSDKSKRGVCAFFHASAGDWDQSPGLHKPGETPDGVMKDLCKTVGEPQKLADIKGYYNLNGNLTFTNIGLRMWGPNYFNNPAGPLGPVPPMDAMFHLAFTTGTLMPSNAENPYDVIPDKRVNVGKQEYKINLNDTTVETPRLCDGNIKNRLIRGELYSTWKYMAPFLVKDEEGTIPAGCPEADNSFKGGSAFLRGRPLDQETGIVTFVSTARFASDDNLTFAFKDVMFFMVLNGWFCDPTGSEEAFEGARCYDNKYNERDGLSAVTILH